MINDITKLLKIVELHHYDVNKDKTTFFVNPSTEETFINLYLNHKIIYFLSTSSHNIHLK